MVSLAESLSPSPGSPNPSFATLGVLERSGDLVPRYQLGGGQNTGEAARARGFTTTDSTGAQWVIVSASDRIWATQSETFGAADAGTQNLPIRLVPLPFGEIQSLALSRPGPLAQSKDLLDGYAVVQERLFRIRVPNKQQWLSDEIRLEDAIPVKVWLDEGRGRVGTQDGRVFGLPIPIQLSNRLPKGLAVDFAPLCGDGFALTPTGLYRLTRSGQPISDWQSVPLQSFPRTRGHEGFAAPLHLVRVGKTDHLYLFTESGAAIHLTAACE